MRTTPANRRELSATKLALLEAMLREQGVNGPSHSAPARRARGDFSPLSFAQQRLWFLDQLAPGSSLYNVDLSLPLRFEVDVDALRAALNEIVRRHEALRTTFHFILGEPVQRVSPKAAIDFPTDDLDELAGAERAAEVHRIVQEEAQHPFDLEQGPLFRARLLRLAAEDYILLIGMHHIVSDGWSLEVFSRELSALYEAYALGQTSPLPPLPLQYSDFAIWQREWLSGPVLEKHLTYWRKQLEGVPALQMPADYPRPSEPSFRGATQSLFVPKATCDELRALSHSTGGTLFMTLLAAFKTLLLRYIGREDIVVGSPVANRNRSEIEGLIGFFVNTLVLRTDLSGDPTFIEALSRVRETALGAYAHQDMPFEKLVEDLHPERDVNHTPLFQVMFVLADDVSGADEPASDEDGWDIEEGTAKFDLTLSFIGTAGGLRGIAEYRTDLFAHETIRALLQHFRILVAGIAANPNARLSQLPILSEEERQEIIHSWNRTEASYDRSRCIHQLVDAVASARPEALAVTSGEHALTYGELNRRSTLLAKRIREWGVLRNTVVPVLMQRSTDWIVALLAVLKSGAAYLPVDPGLPPQRLSFLLADCRCSVILSEQSLLNLIPNSSALRVFCVDRDWHLLRDTEDRSLTSLSNADDLAYVIYTSGSTGEPKGVEISHGSLANLAQWHRSAYSILPDDRASQLANPSFDASVWEIWPYLAAGASVHIMDAATRNNPAQVMQWMAEHAITVAFLPTPLAAIALEQPLPPRLELRAMLTGGDFLNRAPSQPLGFPLFNHYGPTENTVVTTAAEIDAQCGEPPPIGRPISNVRTYALDRHLNLVPPGAVGELYIGGDGLARGYLHRPELTRERFVASPFHPNERLYRSGDLVRQRRDGALLFVGRSDNQVKIRGYRIELGEIESVLRKHASIREAVVIARKIAPDDKRLVAYLVPSTDGSVEPADVSSWLAAELPAYMVPGAIVIVDALPLTPNGKIDTAALPAPAEDYRVRVNSFAAPRTEMERRVGEVWTDILGVGQVGVNDNFFDLGGHSLLMIRLQVKLRDTLERPVSILDLFRYPTVRTFAEYLTAGQANSPSFADARLRAHKQREALNRQNQKRLGRANSHG